MMERLIKLPEAAILLGITHWVLRRKVHAKKISCIKRDGRYYFNENYIRELTGEKIKGDERECITWVYARVSTHKQKGDLITQKDRVVSYCVANGYKVNRVFKEIGSGINDKRKQFVFILKNKDKFDKLVVEHKDRFSRMGFNSLNILLDNKLEVINIAEDKIEDLTDDLVSIITSFCARLYGQRRGKRKTIQITNVLEEK